MILEHGRKLMEADVDKNILENRYATLTGREREVFELLVSDASNTSNKIIAKKLNISHRTVDDHRAKIMLKMQAESLIELVDMAKLCEPGSSS